MTTEQIQTRYGKIAAIFCQYCAKAKVKAAPVSKVVVEKAKDFGDKIHMDVAGKFQRPARGTSRISMNLRLLIQPLVILNCIP